MMQTDVKSGHLSASGEIFGGPTRLKGFAVTGQASKAGSVVFKDGGASGTTICEFDIVSNSNPNAVNIIVPGEGIKCNTTLYATLTNATGVTVFYG